MTGVLWVTIDDDPTDYVLQAGDSLVIESKQAVLVTAMGCLSTLAVCTPPTSMPGAVAKWRQLLAWVARPAPAALVLVARSAPREQAALAA